MADVSVNAADCKLAHKTSLQGCIGNAVWVALKWLFFMASIILSVSVGVFLVCGLASMFFLVERSHRAIGLLEAQGRLVEEHRGQVAELSSQLTWRPLRAAAASQASPKP